MIPKFLLQQLYTPGSLRNTNTGFGFTVKNPFLDCTIVQVHKVAVDGRIYELETTRASGFEATTVTPEAPLSFPRGADLEVEVDADPLEPGRRNLYVKVETAEFGPLKIDVNETVR